MCKKAVFQVWAVVTKLQMKNSTDKVERYIYIGKNQFLKFQKKSRFVNNCKNVGGERFLAFGINK